MLAQTLLDIAVDLSQSLPKKALYQRFMTAVNQVMPCDAVALLEYQGNELRPVAVDGLLPEVLGMGFAPHEHPRLEAIMASRHPIRFNADSELADPYDGYLVIDPKRVLDVHACIGCSLYVEDTLVGVLTLDSLNVGAFDTTSDISIATLAALAAATIRNVNLLTLLERQESHWANDIESSFKQKPLKKSDFIGETPCMLSLKDDIRIVANSDLSVLISGETGVGKEVVARTLHAQSKRKQQALVQLNCAALPETLAESELFGHVKGAFTGATKDRMGKFELAHQGTLFLDEVGELSLELQAKLLRVIQDGEIQRLGLDRNIHVDVRIIAASNRNLLHAVSEGRFREDLYHRLCVYPLHVPPLRERQRDIPPLCGNIVTNLKHKIGLSSAKTVRLSEDAMQTLLTYSWPGNVRELQNVLMRAALKASAEGKSVTIIQPHHLTFAGEQFKHVSTQPRSSLSVASAAQFSTSSPLQPEPLKPEQFKQGLTNQESPKSEPAIAVVTSTTTANNTQGDDALNNNESLYSLFLDDGQSFNDKVADFQRQIIRQSLEDNNQVWAKAARQLQLDRGNLHRQAKRLGLIS
ncbi:nitric oxide reductase transcriptional regulator NorR [Shewanella sp. OMA3-2]|uniref:nitric oxide reductase transcriptional regulator NorR n=1 Tax=Shewanella sp. OMA3-2 TaxID=2908650 RepID=UPI001F436290|nr:nitric oxide reductase transcriptional regulator NorR [Shewanella sp. OMA3-2]UJF22719.1 nitric oxide reductase transcriptional regulator NorR [Shewanella sp. OMA3-2]